MKKLMLMVMLVGLSRVTARAAVYEGNPDKMPSIGLNLGGVSESGTSKATASGASASQDMTVSSGHLVLDLRLPVSNSVTLSAAIGSVSTTVKAEETPILFGNDGKTSGVSFDVGVRFYIH